MTRELAARLLGVAPNTVMSWQARGLLPAELTMSEVEKLRRKIYGETT